MFTVNEGGTVLAVVQHELFCSKQERNRVCSRYVRNNV